MDLKVGDIVRTRWPLSRPEGCTIVGVVAIALSDQSIDGVTDVFVEWPNAEIWHSRDLLMLHCPESELWI